MAAIYADDIFNFIFFNENIWISINISLKFFPKGPINNNTALVQIMAGRLLVDKPLSDPMLIQILWRIYAALGGVELTVSFKVASRALGQSYNHHMIAIIWSLQCKGPRVQSCNGFCCKLQQAVEQKSQVASDWDAHVASLKYQDNL